MSNMAARNLRKCVPEITSCDVHCCPCLYAMFNEYNTVFLLIIDGSPDGFCSDSVLCKDDNSVCSSSICQCNVGHRNIEGVCREGNVNFLLVT